MVNDSPQWVPIGDLFEIINNPDWAWSLNTRCKYLNIRLDTRTHHCIVEDRNGVPITLDELRYQYRADTGD